MNFSQFLTGWPPLNWPDLKKQKKLRQDFSGWPPAARIFFILGALAQTGRRLIFLTAHTGRAREFFYEMKSFQARFWPDLEQRLYPGFEVVPALEKTADPRAVAGSLEILDLLKHAPPKVPVLILMTVKSSLFKFSRPSVGTENIGLELSAGQRLDPELLAEKLVKSGYEPAALVEAPGQFCRRGGILDIFPAQAEQPVRLDFLGETLDTLRFFSVESQKSQARVNSIKIFPVVPPSGGPNSSIFDYISDRDILILDEPEEIARTAEQLTNELPEINKYFFTDSAGRYLARVQSHPLIFQLYQFRPADRSREPLAVAVAEPSEFDGRLDEIKEHFNSKLNSGQKILVVSRLAERVREILGPLAGHDNLQIVSGDLSRGLLVTAAGLEIFSDRELFGFSRNLQDPLLTVAKAGARHQPSDLKNGDYLVHMNYGIGIFRGLKKIKVAGAENEYLLLEYADEDRLFVPAHQLELVEKYTGVGRLPRVSHLGGRQWALRKQLARGFADELARRLYYLYQKRKSRPGFPFPADTPWQAEMEAAFPFEETPHQLEAILAVKKDMESPAPMDRLVLGDVGYGKTEVALRAAFKAAVSGKQAAILAPTTILAEQHFDNFSSRLKAFPVRIEMLSRFKSPAEQKKIIRDLAEGRVDIVIGTHRLLGRDIVFKDLGLLIIDEEQRFGVAHKEKIKSYKNHVDVLVLSATPIPRTFQMAISGISDLSLISTAPEDRRPVKTRVAAFDRELIRSAIIFELEREGQVFFVHNRIQSIKKMAGFVQNLIPGIKIGIIHGRQDETEIEQAMLDFKQGRTNLLLSTAIIENGLDLANVNTLIVNDAQRFGLSELYQLRGRVGRSDRQAFAYFLFNPESVLTAPARSRLQAVQDFCHLGDGYKIAQKDLEIRGAGLLYGAEQHGHMADVGFGLYSRMLEDSVKTLLGQPAADNFEPELKLPVSAFIPKSYLVEESLRLSQYQRLLRARNISELEEIRREFGDRFGKLPPEVINLFLLVKIKFLARELKIKKIEKNDQHLLLDLSGHKQKDRDLWLARAGRAGGRVMMAGEQLLVNFPAARDFILLEKLEKFLRLFIN